MAAGREARCRSCDAEIVWAVTEAHGRPMPLDAHTSERGNVQLVTDDDGRMVARVLAGLFLEQAHADDVALYLPHFASCPNAERHRR